MAKGITRAPIVGWLTRYASGLRFPMLAAITAVLFVLDLLVPDVIPLADELVLGLLTVLLARLKKPRASPGRDREGNR